MAKNKTIFSKRTRSLKASPTIALNALAGELAQQGKDIINLTAGEPDSNTPSAIKNAAKKALDQDNTRYSPSAGIKPLRQAIASKLTQANGIPANWDEVIVGVGAKQLLAATLQLLCQEGDQVIIPTPTWGTFISQTHLSGAAPILLRLKQPFVLTAKAFSDRITAKTKALILNSPSNPTGAVIPKQELKAIAILAVKHKIFIISDETYEPFIYINEKHTSIASLSKAVRAQAITINTFSKAYAMTGWRVGYAHAHPKIAKQLTALSSQTTTGTSSISQHAALKAITGSQLPVKKISNEFARRRHTVIQTLSQIPEVSANPPDGAFYFFINIKKSLKARETSIMWCKRLLETKGVAVVPGEAFSYPGYIRLSFAAKQSAILEGLKRIKDFVD